MASNQGQTILAFGILGLGYVLYKQGAFNKLVKAGGGNPATPNASRAVGSPTPNFSFSIGPQGVQSGSQFGLDPNTLIALSGIAAPAENGQPAILASQEGALSTQPYVLVDSNGNPIPGAT